MESIVWIGSYSESYHQIIENFKKEVGKYFNAFVFL